QDRDDVRHNAPGLAAQAVAQHAQLEPGEVAGGRRAGRVGVGRRGARPGRGGYSHDSSWPVAVRPPTTATNTSSRSRPARTWSSVPTAGINPSFMIATWLHSFSTTSMT